VSRPEREGTRLAESVRRIFKVLAQHLDAYVEGDDGALERLEEALFEGGFGADELLVAALALRLWGEEHGVGAAAALPAKAAHRVPSSEEREWVSPEAWGYLLDLWQRGSLNGRQFEDVLARMMTSGARPAGLELARELAAQIVLEAEGPGGARHGSQRSGH
jgi:uncharacterized protein Smg (DUF494 family)